jgi:hypothetical protein
MEPRVSHRFVALGLLWIISPCHGAPFGTAPKSWCVSQLDMWKSNPTFFKSIPVAMRENHCDYRSITASESTAPEQSRPEPPASASESTMPGQSRAEPPLSRVKPTPPVDHHTTGRASSGDGQRDSSPEGGGDSSTGSSRPSWPPSWLNTPTGRTALATVITAIGGLIGLFLKR